MTNLIEVQRRNGVVQSELLSQEVYSRRSGSSHEAYNYIVDGYDKVLVEQNGDGAWVEKYVIENYAPPQADDVEQVYQRCVELEEDYEGERLVFTTYLDNGQCGHEDANGDFVAWSSGYIAKCLEALIEQGRISTDDKMLTLKICK